jgi:hypothetical protein
MRIADISSLAVTAVMALAAFANSIVAPTLTRR